MANISLYPRKRRKPDIESSSDWMRFVSPKNKSGSKITKCNGHRSGGSHRPGTWSWWRLSFVEGSEDDDRLSLEKVREKRNSQVAYMAEKSGINASKLFAFEAQHGALRTIASLAVKPLLVTSSTKEYSLISAEGFYEHFFIPSDDSNWYQRHSERPVVNESHSDNRVELYLEGFSPCEPRGRALWTRWEDSIFISVTADVRSIARERNSFQR